jgi:hypothetical protein
MTWPAIILWLMILLASVSRGPLILYLFSGTVIFGALTMAPPGLTGGLNLPAQTICAIILLIKIFLRSDNLMLAIRQGLDIRKLGLLGFFMVYVLVTALVYPRLFGGSVMLYSLNAAASESVLAPTSANFTQTIYLLISSALVFAFATAGRSPTFRKIYLRSIIFAGVLLVASGVIDLACSMAGLSRLLQPFHNAAYASLDTVFIAGQYRVVGFMPEASDYGTATCTVLSFLLFNYRFFDAGLKRYFLPLFDDGACLDDAYVNIVHRLSWSDHVGFIVCRALAGGADSHSRTIAGAMATGGLCFGGFDYFCCRDVSRGAISVQQILWPAQRRLA